MSIVVPVYNVEKYIAECLESLLDQTTHNIEIIVVDDRGTDSSMDVVRAIAATDRRVRIVTQPHNTGLGMARNAGAAEARGRYLCFVDSDDTLHPRMCEDVSRVLDRTDSDFAIFGYERFNSKRTWSAGPWITALHEVTRESVAPSDYPQMQVNQLAGPKLFRRSFWVDKGLGYPVGKYEDQPGSALAYAKAERVDIIGATYFRWRRREDGSSISQQIGDVDDLRERINAARSSLSILSQHRPALTSARLGQLVANDFTFSLGELSSADEAYWEVLHPWIVELLSRPELDPQIWSEVQPMYRVAYRLVLRGDRDALVDLFGLGGGNIKNFPTRVIDGRPLLQLPQFGADGFTEDDFELLPRNLRLLTATRRVRWADDHTLVLAGWSYIDNIDAELYPPTTTAFLVDSDSDERLELRVERDVDVEASRVSRHRHANYDASAFRIAIDTDELRLPSGVQQRVFTVHLRTRAAGLEADARLAGQLVGGSAWFPLARYRPDGSRVMVRFNDRGQTEILVQQPRVVLQSVEQHRSTVSLTVSTPSSSWDRIRLSQPGGKLSIEEPLMPDGKGTRTATFTLPSVPPASADEAGDPQTESRPRPWTVRVMKGLRTSAPIAWPPASVEPRWEDPLGPRLFRTTAGNVSVDQPTAVVEVGDAVVVGDELELSVLVSGRRIQDCRLFLKGAKVSPEAVVDLELGRSVVRLPLRASTWGGPLLPLPTGRYELKVRASGERIQVGLHADVLDALPILVQQEKFRARLERSRHGQLVVRVVTPLLPEESGPRHQRELQDWHAELDPEPLPRTALFRAYYGENTACNPGAIYAELQRLGSDITAYFAVSDFSVHVPDGAIPVLHESREWYRLLRCAEFIVDNTHQPIYHVKAPHQKVVETFHGYPFKVNGHPHWDHLGFTHNRIASFDRRAREWDYLVSPATYATPLLRRDFRYDGTVLEVGYPRNDVLLAPEGDQIRQRVRTMLGVEPHQRAILYAPTFRDYLAVNDFSAPPVEFLQIQEMLDALGPDYVLLMRGHAFNARAGASFSGAQVVDVTTYPDVADLYLAADAAIVDYSSLRFDFALTRKPMVFLVPDLQRYVDDRGWLFDFVDSAPGPHVNDTADVIDALRDLDALQQSYAETYEKFLATYVDLDDGHAGERLVRTVFAPAEDRTAHPGD